MRTGNRQGVSCVGEQRTKRSGVSAENRGLSERRRKPTTSQSSPRNKNDDVHTKHKVVWYAPLRSLDSPGKSQMKKQTAYIQHPGKVVETDPRFEHVVSLMLRPPEYTEGIIRGTERRDGDVEISGYIDWGALYKVRLNSSGHFEIGDRLVIKNESEIIDHLGGGNLDLMQLEDPDIWIDEKTGMMHVYFTMILRNKIGNLVVNHLGHSEGKDLNSLVMTTPALISTKTYSGKEASIAPLNTHGVRNNLVESSLSGKSGERFRYSTVRIASARKMGEPWKYGRTVFHPAEHKIPWIAAHASPGPLLPKSFADLGSGKALGIMNGREANKKIGKKEKYGMFSIGLFIYDYENGKIDWVSPVPLIQDTEAKTVTFASQFVETKPGQGVLYAHVDDSFVRAYTLNAEKIKALLPKQHLAIANIGRK